LIANEKKKYCKKESDNNLKLLINDLSMVNCVKKMNLSYKIVNIRFIISF